MEGSTSSGVGKEGSNPVWHTGFGPLQQRRMESQRGDLLVWQKFIGHPSRSRLHRPSRVYSHSGGVALPRTPILQGPVGELQGPVGGLQGPVGFWPPQPRGQDREGGRLRQGPDGAVEAVDDDRGQGVVRQGRVSLPEDAAAVDEAVALPVGYRVLGAPRLPLRHQRGVEERRHRPQDVRSPPRRRPPTRLLPPRPRPRARRRVADRRLATVAGATATSGGSSSAPRTSRRPRTRTSAFWRTRSNPPTWRGG